MIGEWKSLLSEVGAFSPAAFPTPAAWNFSWYLSPCVLSFNGGTCHPVLLQLLMVLVLVTLMGKFYSFNGEQVGIHFSAVSL